MPTNSPAKVVQRMSYENESPSTSRTTPRTSKVSNISEVMKHHKFYPERRPGQGPKNVKTSLDRSFSLSSKKVVNELKRQKEIKERRLQDKEKKGKQGKAGAKKKKRNNNTSQVNQQLQHRSSIRHPTTGASTVSYSPELRPPASLPSSPDLLPLNLPEMHQPAFRDLIGHDLLSSDKDTDTCGKFVFIRTASFCLPFNVLAYP